MVGAVVQEKADLYLRPEKLTTTVAPSVVPILNSTLEAPYSIVTVNTTAVPLPSTTRHHPTAADLTDEELRVRVGLAMSVSFMAGIIQVHRHSNALVYLCVCVFVCVCVVVFFFSFLFLFFWGGQFFFSEKK